MGNLKNDFNYNQKNVQVLSINQADKTDIYFDGMISGLFR